ncbi:MAG: glutamate-5-semialdehyde dehydrogenase [Bradymonadaceae bacterium]|nr:glutamate-5-semialdehyde dehydrogenase [Lujinxingiaceae bacterium]
MESNLENLTEVADIARRVQSAARQLAREKTAAKDDALQRMAEALVDQEAAILSANTVDLEAAHRRGLDAAFVDRLALSPAAIAQMAAALEELTRLPDPVGGYDEQWVRPNGLQVGKKRIPLGVIGIIYESRPNVTSDAAGLCLKSGNGVILKGGSDAFASNRAVYTALRQGIAKSRLSAASHDAVGFIDTTRREAVQEMLGLDQYIDVIIPRGGKALIDFVRTHARMPVIKHDEGICHLVIDGSARAEDVDAIAINAKTHRPGVCNTVETLLVTDDGVEAHLARVLTKLAAHGVRLHLCARSMAVARQSDISPELLFEASDEDYRTEYLALALSVRVVADLDAAIAHIDQYSSRHTESLITQRLAASQQFVDQVDSSVVMINASTRFSDGGQLGLGAEIGISTTRMHAYGPMGLKELTATKFVVIGDGQIRT